MAGNAQAGAQATLCEDKAFNSEPMYGNLTCQFAGTAHRLQMPSAPGATIILNRDGEPQQ